MSSAAHRRPAPGGCGRGRERRGVVRLHGSPRGRSRGTAPHRCARTRRPGRGRRSAHSPSTAAVRSPPASWPAWPAPADAGAPTPVRGAIARGSARQEVPASSRAPPRQPRMSASSTQAPPQPQPSTTGGMPSSTRRPHRVHDPRRGTRDLGVHPRWQRPPRREVGRRAPSRGRHPARSRGARQHRIGLRVRMLRSTTARCRRRMRESRSSHGARGVRTNTPWVTRRPPRRRIEEGR